MQRNTAGQEWGVFAFNRLTNLPQSGDASNITGLLRIGNSPLVPTIDENPTEISNGFYAFNMTQAETDGNYIMLLPESSTPNIQVIGCPAGVFTTPPLFNANILATANSITGLQDISTEDIINSIKEGSLDLKEMVRIMFSILAGHGVGGGSPNVEYKDPSNTKTRFAATVDSNGNRIPQSYDGE